MAAVSLGRKRRRTGLTIVQRAARPIDKVLPNVAITSLVNAQQVQTLVTAATACTSTGIRWSLNVASVDAADTSGQDGAWSIIILRDGRTANTMALTAGANLYEPEQDVLAFGYFQIQGKGDATGTGPSVMHFEGNTKTMRKLKIGDALTFIAIGRKAAVECDVTGVIQIFCKF